jgi:hypothetical protein
MTPQLSTILSALSLAVAGVDVHDDGPESPGQ